MRRINDYEVDSKGRYPPNVITDGDESDYIRTKYANIEGGLQNFYRNECAFLELKNINEYKDKLSIDEDSIGTKKCIKDFYSEKDVGYLNCYSSFTKIPDELIDFYDIFFLLGGEELAHKIIDETPSAIFSLIDWGSIAIQSSISPDDIEIRDYKYFDKLRRCRFENERVKDERSNPYGLVFRDHSIEGIDRFKNYIVDNIKEKLQNIDMKEVFE
jgi:hypothetical protein